MTDTGEFRTEHYHGPGDLTALLDFGFLQQVTQSVVTAVLELGGLPR